MNNVVDVPVYGKITAASPPWIRIPRNWHGDPLHSSPPEHDSRADKRPSPREVIQLAHAIPAEVLNAVDADRVEVTPQQYGQAHANSWAGRMRLVFYGGKMYTTSTEAFDKLRPHLWAATARYTELYECRNFSDLDKTILVMLGVNAVGKTLDDLGHHSYNEEVAWDKSSQEFVARLFEPQANVYVDHAYPQHGYTGHGQVNVQ